MEYIRLGKIINTHGIKGDLKIDLETDFFKERFALGNTVYLLDDGEYRPLEVVRSRIHKGYGLVSFKGLEDINLVEGFKNKELYYPLDQIKPLDDGYYFRQIIGLEAHDDQGNLLGQVIAMEQTRMYNLMRIKKDDKEVLVPFTDVFVKEVDEEKNRIIINVIEGLF